MIEVSAVAVAEACGTAVGGIGVEEAGGVGVPTIWGFAVRVGVGVIAPSEPPHAAKRS